MNRSLEDPFEDFRPHRPPERKRNWLKWFIGIAGGMCFLCCGGLLVGLVYIGAKGPETSVYLGSQLPASYRQTAKDVGALEDGEKIEFFYSDGLIDIRDGFYFVSDRKLVIYSEDGRDPALRKIAFEDIEDMELIRELSSFEDSTITIQLTDGEWIAFPVSSELNRDQQFFDTLNQKRPLPNQAAEMMPADAN